MSNSLVRILRSLESIAFKNNVRVQDFYTPDEVAIMLKTSKKTLYKLSKREQDPFPYRKLIGSSRGLIVFRNELIEWMERNYTPIKDVSDK